MDFCRKLVLLDVISKIAPSTRLNTAQGRNIDKGMKSTVPAPIEVKLQVINASWQTIKLQILLKQTKFEENLLRGIE